MAIVDPVYLQSWITDVIWIDVGTPKVGDTGSLDTWVTDTIWIDVFVEAPPVATRVTGSDAIANGVSAGTDAITSGAVTGTDATTTGSVTGSDALAG